MSDNQYSPKGPALLKQHEDNWRTDMGSIIFGQDAILRGKSVLYDFNDSSWMEFFIFGITGKKLKEYPKFLEGIWRITTSYPDPRLWNNRVAALAGTARSTGALAVSAAIAVSEATNFGLRPIKGSLDFLYRAQEKINEGLTIEEITKEELKKHRSIYGFGRPLATADERIRPFLDFSKSLGFNQGNYTNLAFEIESYLKSTRLKYQLNAAGLVAGLVADQNISTEEHYYMGILCFVAGILPCYIDALQNDEGGFFPLSTARLNFTGPKQQRKWTSNI